MDVLRRYSAWRSARREERGRASLETHLASEARLSRALFRCPHRLDVREYGVDLLGRQPVLERQHFRRVRCTALEDRLRAVADHPPESTVGVMPGVHVRVV